MQKSHFGEDDVPLPAVPRVKVGDHIELKRGKTGIILYIGCTKFSEEKEIIGIKLDVFDPSSHSGKGYFNVPHGRGYFTQKQNICKIISSNAPQQNQNAIKIEKLKNELREINILEWKQKNGIILPQKQLSKIQKKQQYKTELEAVKTNDDDDDDDNKNIKLNISELNALNPSWKTCVEMAVQLGFNKVTIIDRNSYDILASTSIEDIATSYMKPTSNLDEIIINENEELTHDWIEKIYFWFYGKKFQILIRSTDHEMYRQQWLTTEEWNKISELAVFGYINSVNIGRMIIIPNDIGYLICDYVDKVEFRRRGICNYIVGQVGGNEVIIVYQFEKVWFVAYTRSVYGIRAGIRAEIRRRYLQYCSGCGYWYCCCKRSKTHYFVDAQHAWTVISTKIFHLMQEAGL